MKNNLVRHGDVSLVPVKLPKGAGKGKEVSELVIAFGEQTGHNHTLVAEPGARYKVVEANGERYFVLNKTATLTHPEHKTITVFPGMYVQGQEREKDWFSLSVRKVID